MKEVLPVSWVGQPGVFLVGGRDREVLAILVAAAEPKGSEHPQLAGNTPTAHVLAVRTSTCDRTVGHGDRLGRQR
jgi:hypothetical protein